MPCRTFKPWHDKETGKTGLRLTAGQCPHYFFYFNDTQLGLCHIRVQSGAPFRLQFCLNGHSWLSRWLEKESIAHRMEDNAFVHVAGWEKTQQMAQRLDPTRLYTAFRRLRQQVISFGKGHAHFRSGVNWSVMQIELSHNIVFGDTASLGRIYEQISRQAMLAVKASEVARILGKPVPRRDSKTPAVSDHHTRIEGRRIKHFMDPASLKM